MKKKLDEFLHAIIHNIFPNYCIFCEENLSINEKIICSNCLKSIPKFNNILLEKFFKRIPEQHFDHLIICLEFEQKIQQMMHLFKYSGYKVIAEILASVVFERVKNKKYDIIYFVPLHPAKKRERGYNQSELIARHLAYLMQLDMSMDLERKKYTKSQTKLTRMQRMENVKDVFVVSDNCYDKSILLIDDIITTGSTLNECSKTLKKAHAKKIDAAAIATPINILQENLEQDIENSLILT